MTKKIEGGKTFFISLPADMHKEFKSACAAEGQTMTSTIKNLMTKYVVRKKKQNDPDLL